MNFMKKGIDELRIKISLAKSWIKAISELKEVKEAKEAYGVYVPKGPATSVFFRFSMAFGFDNVGRVASIAKLPARLSDSYLEKCDKKDVETYNKLYAEMETLAYEAGAYLYYLQKASVRPNMQRDRENDTYSLVSLEPIPTR